MTNEEIIAKFGEPPQGTVWLRDPYKNIILDNDGKPIAKKRKQSMKRNRSKLVQYAIPQGKLNSPETPGYDAKIHKALREMDFADPLHFLQWKRDQLKLQLQAIEVDIQHLSSAGQTPEARQKQQNVTKAINDLKRLIAKDGATDQLKEQLAELLATIS